MAHEKIYRVIVPVENGADLEVLRWLERESFEKRATADSLQIVDYTERSVSVEDINPKAVEQLGRPATDFDWFEFTGVARLDESLFDWLSAECAWYTEQISAWLAAESDYVRAREWASLQDRNRA